MVIIFKLNYGGWICCTTNTKQQKQHTGYIYIYISIKSYNILKKERGQPYIYATENVLYMYIYTLVNTFLFICSFSLLKIEEIRTHLFFFDRIYKNGRKFVWHGNSIGHGNKQAHSIITAYFSLRRV